jgi:hypothetical protein
LHNYLFIICNGFSRTQSISREIDVVGSFVNIFVFFLDNDHEIIQSTKNIPEFMITVAVCSL